MYCSNCGSNVDDAAHFCPNCGASLRTESPEADNQTYTIPPAGSGADFEPESTYADANTYNGGYSTGLAMRGSRPVRTDRDLVTYVLLSIVTCGIYGYWYVYQLALDANVMCASDGDETPGLGAYILFSFLTCGIYSLYWEYKLGNRLQANAPAYGLRLESGGSDILIWRVVGILLCFIASFVGMNILIKNANELARAYNYANGF